MFSGGIGKVLESNLDKLPPQADQVIFRLGGPAYRIGMGGVVVLLVELKILRIWNRIFKRSRGGDPSTANKIVKFLRKVLTLKNVITAIHDQGSVDTNVTREISEPLGARNIFRSSSIRRSYSYFLEKWWRNIRNSGLIFIFRRKFKPSSGYRQKRKYIVSSSWKN